MHIVAPPLRDRREDVPLLIDYYLREAARELGTPPKRLAPEALNLLECFDWPGNVRQLVNACRRLTITAPGSEIRPEDIPDELGGRAGNPVSSADWALRLSRWAEQSLRDDQRKSLLDVALPEFERALITAALAHARGHRQEAAKLLGWGRNTLARKIREHDLE